MREIMNIIFLYKLLVRLNSYKSMGDKNDET